MDPISDALLYGLFFLHFRFGVTWYHMMEQGGKWPRDATGKYSHGGHLGYGGLPGGEWMLGWLELVIRRNCFF